MNGPLAAVRWDASGLVPVVIADADTGAVLTLAYANQTAVERTLETRSTWLWSRSRGRLWNKGEESGNTQRVVSVALDCDGDALLYRVVPAGPACHTGAMSCFANSRGRSPRAAAPPDPVRTRPNSSPAESIASARRSAKKRPRS